MIAKNEAPDNEPLTTPGDMHLTRISRAELLRALKTNDKQIVRIKPRKGSRANAGYAISPARERRLRTKRITPPSVGSVRRANKVANIIRLHNLGWLMKAIVPETQSTYAFVDKTLRQAGLTPNYSNTRPNRGS